MLIDMLIESLFSSQFCTAALEHSTSAVRELAVRIILSMYQQHRAAVLTYLPPNDAATRKNFLYKTLFDGFAKIDGKLVETQARSVFFSSLQIRDSFHNSSHSDGILEITEISKYNKM